VPVDVAVDRVWLAVDEMLLALDDRHPADGHPLVKRLESEYESPWGSSWMFWLRCRRRRRCSCCGC